MCTNKSTILGSGFGIGLTMLTMNLQMILCQLTRLQTPRWMTVQLEISLPQVYNQIFKLISLDFHQLCLQHHLQLTSQMLRQIRIYLIKRIQHLIMMIQILIIVQILTMMAIMLILQ